MPKPKNTPKKSPSKAAAPKAASPKKAAKSGTPAKATTKPITKSTAKATAKATAPKAKAKPAKPSKPVAEKSKTKNLKSAKSTKTESPTAGSKKSATPKAPTKAAAKSAKSTVAKPPVKAKAPVAKPSTTKKTENKGGKSGQKKPVERREETVTHDEGTTTPPPKRREPIVPQVDGIKLPPDASAWLVKQAHRLLDLRDSILETMDGVARENLRTRPEGSEANAFGMHQADAGSDAYDRDFALSLFSQEQDALYEIEEAIQRLQEGTYGICEMSNKKIPHERLVAIPFARFTVECQAEVERQGYTPRQRQSMAAMFGGTDEESSDSDEGEGGSDN